MVCSSFAPECPERMDARHIEWLKHHSDSHPQREVMFCLKGEVVCSLNDKLYACPPGSLLLFDVGEKHDQGYPPGSHAVHLWLFFFPKHIIARLNTIMDGRVGSGKSELFVDNPGLSHLLNQEWSRIKNSTLDEALKRKRLAAVFLLLFIELIESDRGNHQRSEGDEGTSGRQQRKIIRLIEEHIRNTSGSGLNIEKLARISGYSKFHFLRLFKQKTGYKVHDYINLSRMSRIVEMEAQGARQKEIAAALGFSCPSAYSHWRQKHLKR